MDASKQWALRPMQEEELDTLYAERIEVDFPSAERPSIAAMHRHVHNGLQNVWIMTEETPDGVRDAAYAVCAEANGIVLVTLLAVFAENRGGGRGSALLSLLRAQYEGKRAIVLEVEDPKDATDAADLNTRERRIAFYERNGYRFLTGLEHISFGVPLLPMAVPIVDTMENLRQSAVQDLQAIYHHILPEHLWPRVTTREA